MKLNSKQFNLPERLEYTLNSMPRGCDEVTPITNTCNVVNSHVSIDIDGNCFLCSCDGYLPIPVGNVLDFDSLEQVFQSPTANVLLEDIANKKFSWCAVNYCGIKYKNTNGLYGKRYKYYIGLNIDESCNLSCPSCRREKVMLSTGPEFDKKLKMIEKFISWLDSESDPVYLTLTGNGDPLASHIIRPLIKNWKWDHHRVELKTNGLLAKKQLSGTNFLNSIDRFSISIDAGSKQVYENVRRPGNWEKLLENLEFIQSTKIKTVYNFVIQKSNYYDIGNYYNLAKKFQAQATADSLVDWGTWTHNPTQNSPDSWTITNGYYVDHNVLDKNNPHHEDCKSIVSSLIKDGTIKQIDTYVLEQLGIEQ